MADFVVTPWEVKGEIDYEKLMEQFGIQPMKNLLPVFNENILFRRNVVFAHRDFQQIQERIKKKEPFVMMTGLMP